MEESKEREKPMALDISSLDTFVLLRLFVNILGEKAWQNMGLRMRSGTDEVEKDMLRAKIAIDTIQFIVNTLEPHFQEDEKKIFRNLLADLQINFVKQS